MADAPVSERFRHCLTKPCIEPIARSTQAVPTAVRAEEVGRDALHSDCPGDCHPGMQI